MARAERSARRLVVAEVSFFRRELDARRLRRRRAILRSAMALAAAQDFGDELVHDLVVLDQLGLSARGCEILADACRKIGRGRNALALGEVYSGRRVPEVPCACELAMPDRWEGAARPGLN